VIDVATHQSDLIFSATASHHRDPLAAQNDASLCQVVRAVFLLVRDVTFFCW